MAAWPALVADIGGTHARFGWVDGVGRGVGHVRTLAVADHAGPAEAAAAYQHALRGELGAGAAPLRAAFAFAAPMDGETLALTNAGWRFTRAGLAAALGVAELRLLNDFEALALALPTLAPAQWRGDAPRGRRTLAVVGPGTGLGVAAALPTPAGWVAVAGEGGHATLAAADDTEAALLADLRRHHAHVSAERLLSGPGLVALHTALARLRGRAIDGKADAAGIVAGAVAGDRDAAATVDAFCALLGSFAGNVALTFGARGGLFIGGGIVPRLGDAFFASRFRERFDAKGRFAAWLRAVPTAVIVDTLAALQGAAAALE
jgi:glucokinase